MDGFGFLCFGVLGSVAGRPAQPDGMDGMGKSGQTAFTMGNDDIYDSLVWQDTLDTWTHLGFIYSFASSGR